MSGVVEAVQTELDGLVAAQEKDDRYGHRVFSISLGRIMDVETPGQVPHRQRRGYVQHGSLSSYGFYGCRCGVCRKAKSDYTKAWNARKLLTVTRHGWRAYKYGCRCVICRTSKSRHQLALKKLQAAR